MNQNNKTDLKRFFIKLAAITFAIIIIILRIIVRSTWVSFYFVQQCSTRFSGLIVTM